jgi:hypothetical protein
MSNTEVRHCTCANTFQDATYGASRRVHNAKRTKDGKSTGWRCTVCARETEGASALPAVPADRAPARPGPKR